MLLCVLLVLFFFNTTETFNSLTMDEVRLYRDHFHPAMKNSYHMPTVSIELDTHVADKIIVYESPKLMLNGKRIACQGKDHVGESCPYIPVIVEFDKEGGAITAFCLIHVNDNYKGPKPTIMPIVAISNAPEIPLEPMMIEIEELCDI